MRQAALTLLGVGALTIAGCSDKSLVVEGSNGNTTVLITNAPFPYDLVSKVELFIERIDASTGTDTIPGANWITVATPNRTVDLLALQNGATATLGEGMLPGGEYRAVRLVIDTDKSRILGPNNAPFPVEWQSSRGRPTLYALVEAPMALGGAADAPGSIVVDVDVGRSFLCIGQGCGGRLIFSPVFRAVSRDATGSISGTIRGASGSVANAPITVVREGPNGAFDPPSLDYQSVVATGRTDAQGRFMIAYLLAGRYGVIVDPPRASTLIGAGRAHVTVTTAHDTPGTDFTLGSAADVTITIDAATNTTVVGDTIPLTARVTGPSGPVPGPSIEWTTSNPTVGTVRAIGTAQALITGLSEGSVTITATFAGKSTSRVFTVTRRPAPAPVVTAELSPASLAIQVRDSVSVRVILKDAAGNPLFGRLVQWRSSDTTVVYVYPQIHESTAILGLSPGTSVITASSEGKSASAVVTVRARQ